MTHRLLLAALLALIFTACANKEVLQVCDAEGCRGFYIGDLPEESVEP